MRRMKWMQIVFAAVIITSAGSAQRGRGPSYKSTVMIFDMATKTSKPLFSIGQVLEAANWSHDGKFLMVNTNGNLYRLPVDGRPAELEQIKLGDGTYRANNDHDYSPDGKMIAFSASSPSSRGSQVYVANADGSNVKLLTPASPSYFHGWSTDGKWLAFVGQRDGKFELFRVSVNGGPEERLTSAGGYDDGPEYHGKWIYFNSNRGNNWRIWRIPTEGSGGAGDPKAEMVTNDELEDWFPHFSPDGKTMLFLSFPHGTETHNDRNLEVKLRMMAAPKDKLAANPKVETLATFMGGQGTINVNSWSPDSKKFAYVTYEEMK